MKVNSKLILKDYNKVGIDSISLNKGNDSQNKITVKGS